MPTAAASLFDTCSERVLKSKNELLVPNRNEIMKKESHYAIPHGSRLCHCGGVECRRQKTMPLS